ncbi:MAG TPA: DNA repair protein RecO [Patescibacteria group bacterium]|jgi:DNA repair protein RecO (recombination protein O)|nr:DNA repair protein RecO [Patescibacteria group bacterium]
MVQQPHKNTSAIILKRINYAEADRIVSFITPDYGKLRLVAKGVRKSKSKLAGGVELFCVSNISFMQSGQGLGTLVSCRLVNYYPKIVKDIDRTMLGYELIKQLDRATEDQPESNYFQLLNNALEALNNPIVDLDLIQIWFTLQLLRIGGHKPNLRTDSSGQQLTENQDYSFNFDSMSFMPSADGRFKPNHIKFLRVGFNCNNPESLQRVIGIREVLTELKPLTQTMREIYIRL